jgi:glycosyltransferase involved in cell wall biosynthesis
MKIVFVTTQTAAASTNLGRILPLAEELGSDNAVHVLVHGDRSAPSPPNVTLHSTGRDPYQRTARGKKRLRGLPLLGRLAANTLRATAKIIRLNPEVVIISKSLPESVFAAWLATRVRSRARLVLDVDDFELTANALASMNQRAAVHAAERVGARAAQLIVAATPFLKDHFEQLTQDKKQVLLLPTGVSRSAQEASGSIALNLLYLGSISLHSGHRVDLLPDILAKVCEQYPDAVLTIAGSGDDELQLKENFSTRGLDACVVWHGRFSPADTAELVQRAAIIIDPVDASITNRAKSSFRTAIAATYGRAIVTSDIGIRPYLVPENFHPRFFAAPAEARSYADKIIALLKEPLTEVERQQLREHARAYQWHLLARQYRAAVSV